MRKSFLFSIFLTLFTGHVFAQTSICGSPASIQSINTAISEQADIKTVTKLKEVFSTKKLILAGEAHYHTLTSYLKDLISYFAQLKGEKGCIAFEFAKRDASFSEFINKVSEAIKAIKAEIESGNLDQETKNQYTEALESFKQIKNYYSPLSQAAEANSLDTYTVDHKDHDFDGEASYSERNKAMAANLEELITSNKCSSVLYFVGKAHLSTSLDTTDKIQDYLSPSLLSETVTLNIQMTREATLPFEGRSWAGCKPPSPSKPIIFRSGIIEEEVSIMPFVNESMPQWIDYDYTYLLPNN